MITEKQSIESYQSKLLRQERIKRASDFNGYSPIMPMQTLAGIAIKGNEMGSTKDKMIFGDTDTIGSFSWHKSKSCDGRKLRLRNDSLAKASIQTGCDQVR